MKPEMILEIENVKQSFRVGFWMKQVEILHGVSFEVPRNSIFGFLGPNGAGKTTLIHLITGLRTPKAGSVRVAGHVASSREARSKIGYLPERPYFHEHLTGEGFLLFMGYLAGLSRDYILSQIPDVLMQVGLSHARHVELKRYSKGMLQRVGIAQAILSGPDLLVLDEPMSGLDPIGRKEIRELIVRLRDEGRSIFFSTHIIPDVEAICDQVAVIQKGKLVGCGPIGKFLSQGPVQTEIGFSGVDEKVAKSCVGGSQVTILPEGFKTVISELNQVNGTLQKLIEARASIMWVNPLRPSLESIFGKESS